VNYRFEFDGVPLLGPGAKAKVAVHHTGVVAGAYCFWRDVTGKGRATTLSADLIFDRFQSSPLFADLSDRTARAEVRSARFGYLCLPPTESMSLLVPAIEMRGTIATEFHPRYDFVSYVGATDVKGADAKRAGFVNACPALLVA
jgi:hypothetical protein